MGGEQGVSSNQIVMCVKVAGLEALRAKERGREEGGRREKEREVARVLKSSTLKGYIPNSIT